MGLPARLAIVFTVPLMLLSIPNVGWSDAPPDPVACMPLQEGECPESGAVTLDMVDLSDASCDVTGLGERSTAYVSDCCYFIEEDCGPEPETGGCKG